MPNCHKCNDALVIFTFPFGKEMEVKQCDCKSTKKTKKHKYKSQEEKVVYQ